MERTYRLTFFDRAVVTVLGLVALITGLKSCGSGETVVQQGPSVPDEPVQCADGSSTGDTRNAQCSAGQTGRIIEICNNQGRWEELDNSCSRQIDECEEEAQNKITFTRDILPILEKKVGQGSSARACLDCHANARDNYRDYDVVVEQMKGPNPELLDRINRDDARRMPKPPNPQLSIQDRTTFAKWKEQGLLKDSECSGKDPYGNDFLQIDLDYIEQKIEQDLQRLDSRSRLESRYLVLGHRYLQQRNRESYDKYIESLTKVLNTLSIAETPVVPTAIDARQTVFRFNLEDFGLESHPRFGFKLNRSGQKVPKNLWDLALDFEPFGLESFTTRGLVIKELTGTDQPWLHFDNFHFTTMNNPIVYYTATDTPTTLDGLLEKIGADLQQQFDDEEVGGAGGNGSPISLNKNRMIYTFETGRSDLSPDNGFAWYTLDPDDALAEGDITANLFEFPFPKELAGRTNKIFGEAASEIIYEKSNGFLGFALFNNLGVRQDEAPGNVVQNTSSRFNPIIVNPIACLDCHHPGILPMEDQVLPSILRNPAFSAAEKRLAENFYLSNSALNATFSAHADKFRNAMQRVGVTTSGVDPANFAMDEHRDDWTLQDLCSALFEEEQRCRDVIQGSEVLQPILGTLLNEGSTVTFAQITTEIQAIRDEFEFGIED